MRNKRAKQIKRILGYTGHTRNVDEKGRKTVSQYRRFKKMYLQDKALTLKAIRRMFHIMLDAKAKDAKTRALKAQKEYLEIDETLEPQHQP